MARSNLVEQAKKNTTGVDQIDIMHNFTQMNKDPANNQNQVRSLCVIESIPPSSASTSFKRPFFKNAQQWLEE